MRHARALLPYAAVALALALTSVAVIGYTLADIRDAHDARRTAVETSASPSATAARTLPELSRTARLAYWRADAAGAVELLASNLDGTLRRPLARAESRARVALTRWTPDGGALAFVDDGGALRVVRLDGTATVLALPADARSAGFRIVDQRWSPDGERVAVSALRSDLRSDVFVGTLGDSELSRATSLEDAFAGDWLDGQTLLVQSGGGVIGVLQPGESPLRPLTGVLGTSPILGDDGRVHFLAGSVTAAPRDVTLPFLSASGATVWSVTATGDGLRRETQTAVDDLRLDAQYAKGRYLAHRGSSQIQVLLGEGVNIPPIDAGPVERAIVSTDRRSVLGFTSSRIVRFELRAGAASPLGPPAVLLDSVAGGDVWYPRSVNLEPSAPLAGARPAARYAFTLGGHLWTMSEHGAASFVRAKTAQIGRRQLPPPAWSANGERVLTLELAGAGLPGITAATPIAVTIDRDGRTARHEASRAATATPSWAPDGSAFAVVVDRRGVDGASPQAELEVRFLALDGTAARGPVSGREAVWTGEGVVLLGDTAIELVQGEARRTIAQRDRLLADPRGEFPTDLASSTFTALGAARDGSYVSVRVGAVPRTGANRFAIALLRTADGAAVRFLQGSGTQDLSWAPRAALFGYTTVSGQQHTAEIRDVAGDRLVSTQAGRFAGWSPDAAWFYVARPEGLFAFPVAGGEGVRVSTIGAPVSTTAP